MTGPLADAAAAADELTKAASQAGKLIRGEKVAKLAEALSEALDDAEPPYGDEVRDDFVEESMQNLFDKVLEWRKIYDKPSIQTVDQLQRLEFADFLNRPVSWVRANCEPSDLRRWADHQPIKKDRIESSASDGGS